MIHPTAIIHPKAQLHESVKVGPYAFIEAGVVADKDCVIGPHVFLTGNTIIGAKNKLQGGSAISKDLPHYTVARGDNGICGLNVLGLRRAGFNAEQRAELKRLYRKLFRTGMHLRVAITEARKKFTGPAAQTMLDFISTA